METITFEKLIENLTTFSSEEIELIAKAYKYAEELHRGQKRESGEEYIIHPLTVAYDLSKTHYHDCPTICAALLHDVVEDTKATIEDIANLFSSEIAMLVNGVTKISRMSFSSKEEQIAANIRKILESIFEDIRIVYIKSSDRLHNMRTMQFKSEEKQCENARETLEIFVPLVNSIGAYHKKIELEDLSLIYLEPKIYNDISQKMCKFKKDTQPYIQEMIKIIGDVLTSKNIPFDIKMRTKNIYGIYKKWVNNIALTDIHDLIALKVIVNSIDDCYLALRWIHKTFGLISNEFKDYIAVPKVNEYSSLHTTVFGPGGNLVQIQIRTKEMDEIDSFGITAYWNINGLDRSTMQAKLRENSQFYNSLRDIISMNYDNQTFVSQVKSGVLSKRVYVYNGKGKIIQLPSGSTPNDYAIRCHLSIDEIIVNDKFVPPNYEFKTGDIIKTTSDISIGNMPEYSGIQRTKR